MLLQIRDSFSGLCAGEPGMEAVYGWQIRLLGLEEGIASNEKRDARQQHAGGL